VEAQLQVEKGSGEWEVGIKSGSKTWGGVQIEERSGSEK
jgi:hypothetical protein